MNITITKIEMVNVINLNNTDQSYKPAFQSSHVTPPFFISFPSITISVGGGDVY